MQPSTIIGIVDDDSGVRGSIDSFIRSNGMRTLEFESAEQLLNSGAEASLACIVTDLYMPGASGLDLQREAKRRGWNQPLIIMTAFPTDDARDEAMRNGAVAFLSKPIDPDTLLDLIEQVIEP
jgi:FixJ family two-component response regulator